VTERSDDESVLRDWLSVLARQKWIVLVVVVAVPLLAFATSRRQEHLYQGSATVLVSAQNPTAQALNLAAAVATPPDRYVATQAKLARVGTVAAMAVRQARVPGHTAAGLLANSSVSADLSSDLLTFSVTDPSPRVAETLANTYAKEFTVYRHRLDRAGLSAAINDARQKLNELIASGEGGSDLSRRLAATAGDLEQLQTLQAIGSSATQVGSADSASLVQPRTKRNVILGVIVGLALGIALAFIREALDTRARTADELRSRLGMPLLGQVPTPSRRHAESGQLATLSRRSSAGAEAFRILKSRLELAQIDHEVGSILITSPREDEDKSTTAANLAVTLAQSGRHVILLDLNLRNPSIHRIFGLRNNIGFTGVAMGIALTSALDMVDVNARRLSDDAGMLEVLTTGEVPPDPGEFLLSHSVPDALAALDERCDLLLINAPPVLAVGDAMTVAKHADAVVLVAGVNRVRRETLIETRQVLDGCGAIKLGVIATVGRAEEPVDFSEPARRATAAARGHLSWWKRLAALTARRFGGSVRRLRLFAARHVRQAPRKLRLFAALSASAASAQAERLQRTRRTSPPNNRPANPLKTRRTGPRPSERVQTAGRTKRQERPQKVPHV
jgi:capsular exopolysaccharide synthesis family protein